MKSKIRSNNVANTFKGSSWAICACLVCCFAVDAGVALALLLTGMSSFVVLPTIAAVIDLIFFFVALASNFRFKYGLVSFLLYILAYVTLCVLTFVFMANVNGYYYMTLWAQVAWLVVHAFAILLTLITYVYSAKNYTKSKVLPTVAVSFALVVMVVAVGLYGITYSQQGYFGQGYEGAVRPIVYEYDEATDSYSAVWVMGKGGTVVIHDSFNGKPVTNVSCNIFMAQGISHIRFEGDVTYTLDNVSSLMFVEDVQISADKEIIDDVKNLFYGVINTEASYAEYAFDFANVITPTNLDANEVYVTYSYNVDTFHRLGGNTLKTWIGNKGDVFTVAEYDEIEFFSKSDVNSDEHLHWSYTQNDGYIFTGLKDNDGVELNGRPVNQSYNVAVDFERIYRVTVEESNDTVYNANDVENRRPTSSGNGFACTYKYVVASTADQFYNKLSDRRGFWVEWTFRSSGMTLGYETLSQVLANVHDDSEISMTPHWQMLDPEYSISTNAVNNTVMYGEGIEFDATVTPVNEDFHLQYSWQRVGGGVDITDSDKVSASIEHIPFEAFGEYRCDITSSAPEISSLTTSTSQSLYVTVTQRTLLVYWNEADLNELNGNMFYSGMDRSVSCSLESSRVMSGDSLDVTVTVNDANGPTSNNKLRNAGDYFVVATLTGSAAQKYQIEIGFNIRSYTIQKATVDAQWSEIAGCNSHGDDHVYSAQAHGYTAQNVGVGEEVGTIVLNYTYSANNNSAINAGTYSVTASLPSEYTANYILTNTVKIFTIQKATISRLDWSSDSDFVYSGDKHQISITNVNGFVDSDLSKFLQNGIVYTVTATQVECLGHEGVYAGTYTVTVRLKDYTDNLYSNNYKITCNDWMDYTVAKKDITITKWDVTSFTYTGFICAPKVESISGAINDEGTGLISSGFSYDYDWDKNVGSDHEITASLKADTVYAINYNITGNAFTKFEITPADVTISWRNATSMVYDGVKQGLTGSCRGVGNDGELKFRFYVQEGDAINVGTYTAAVEFAVNETNSGNYNITNPTKQFEVRARGIGLTWSYTSTVYNGRAQAPVVTEIINVLASDEQALLAELNGSFTANNVNVQNYSVTAILSNNNYTVVNSSLTATYDILPLEISVTWSNTELVYSGQELKPTASAQGVGDDVLTFNVTVNEGSAISVGDYHATAEIADVTLRANYTLSNPTQSFKIVPLQINVTWDTEQTFEYDPAYYENKFPDVNGITTQVADRQEAVTQHKEMLIDALNASRVRVGEYKAGTNVVQITLSNPNFLFEGATRTLEHEFTVNKGTALVDWQYSEPFTYDGTAKVPMLSHNLSSSAYVVTVTAQENSAVSNGKAVNAGKYVATVALSDAYSANYTLYGNNSVEFTINKKDVTLAVMIGEHQFATRPSIEELTPFLSCFDFAFNLVDGHTVKNVEYAYVSDASGNDGYMSVTAIKETIKIFDGDTDVTDNYEITVSAATLTLVEGTDVASVSNATVYAVVNKEVEYAL